MTNAKIERTETAFSKFLRTVEVPREISRRLETMDRSELVNEAIDDLVSLRGMLDDVEREVSLERIGVARGYMRDVLCKLVRVLEREDEMHPPVFMKPPVAHTVTYAGRPYRVPPGERTYRLVIIESRYAGDIDRNVAYARQALKHSLDRGEAPIASHLLYPQVLDDNDPAQREQGIAAGLAWRRVVIADTKAALRFERMRSPFSMMEREAVGIPVTRRFEAYEPVLPAFYIDHGWSDGMLRARELYIGERIAYETRSILGGFEERERFEP
jgi:hypothetical protein